MSPRLLADYRAQAVSLDQLMALAIVDDHTAQESAFYDAPTWQRNPHNLRERLTEREIDAYWHPLVRFVGLDGYQQAGGGIRRDLFAEGDKGVYLADAALLERLAQDRLASLAAKVKVEGWAWVDASLDADDEEKADALQEEGERLGEQLQALEDGLLDYAANVKAAAAAHAGTAAPRVRQRRRSRERGRRRGRRRRQAAQDRRHGAAHLAGSRGRSLAGGQRRTVRRTAGEAAG